MHGIFDDLYCSVIALIVEIVNKENPWIDKMQKCVTKECIPIEVRRQFIVTIAMIM